jgi:hypothetical protein
MLQDKVHVGARIPKELFDKCVQHFGNMTNAINDGLTLLVEQTENNCSTLENSCSTNCQTTENICSTDVNTNMSLFEEKDKIIKDLQNSIENLSKELLKTGPQDQLLQESFQLRIADLKEQIMSLQEQIKVKDNQLSTRDEEIKQINDNLKGQALIIHNLTQEKKLLAENNKKPWWRFW